MEIFVISLVSDEVNIYAAYSTQEVAAAQVEYILSNYLTSPQEQNDLALAAFLRGEETMVTSYCVIDDAKTILNARHVTLDEFSFVSTVSAN